jgi:hypothetical protein
MDRRRFLGSIGAAAAAMGVRGELLLNALAAEPVSKVIPMRKLGKTGIEVCSLALGGVIGMIREKSADWDASEMANAALDAGITYFDTAPSYGSGLSEKHYGEVMKTRRNEVFLATKTGNRYYDGAMREFEQSLKRLQTDHVDLYQIHGAHQKDQIENWGKPDGVYTAMRKLKEQKAIRFIGVTGHDDADVMRKAIETYEFDTILTTFNPTEKRRPFVERVLPVAVKQNLGIIAMKVMGGALGSLAKGNPAKNDGASNHDDAPHQADAAMLLRYTLGLPGIAVADVGAASIEQVRSNIRAACTKPLEEAERKALEAAMA